MTRVVLIGGGGFAKEVLDLANMSGIEIVGYVAPEKTTLKARYLGVFEDLTSKTHLFDGVTIGFGSINRATALSRAAMIEAIKKANLQPVSIISPHARISSGVQIGAGTVVAHNVILAVDSIVGEHCMLNNASQLGHDACLAQNVTLAPLAFVAGECQIGENALVGPSTSVLQGVRIGRGSIVGVGATVARSLGEDKVVLPNPSRQVGL